MDLFTFVQAGELGLAFVIVMLCLGLVLFVVKTSARREQDYLLIIKTVLPVMEKMSISMSNINLRLEDIEDNQMKLFLKKTPTRSPHKKSDTVPVKALKVVVLPITEPVPETAPEVKP